MIIQFENALISLILRVRGEKETHSVIETNKIQMNSTIKTVSIQKIKKLSTQ